MISCQDCFDFLASVGTASVDLVLIDPPYNLTHAAWDAQPVDWPRLWPELYRVSKGNVLVFSIQPFTASLITSDLKNYRYTWYWCKSCPTNFLNANKQPLRCIEEISVFGRGQYHPQKTPCARRKVNAPGSLTSLYNAYERKEHWTEEEYPRNLLTFASERYRGHPTAKPVKLLEYLLKTYSSSGDTVLDCFCGSGSLGVACVQTGRQYLLNDNDAGYVKMATERIDKMSPMSTPAKVF